MQSNMFEQRGESDNSRGQGRPSEPPGQSRRPSVPPGQQRPPMPGPGPRPPFPGPGPRPPFPGPGPRPPFPGPGPRPPFPGPGPTPTPAPPLITVENALIERIDPTPQGVLVTISYDLIGNENPRRRQQLVLVVTYRTQITSETGNSVSARYLQPGMIINALYSSAMTRSIPPQANAIRINVVRRHDDVRVRVDVVLRVDERNSTLLTGLPGIPNRQMRFNITDFTQIVRLNGRRIPLSAINPGDRVRIEYANFQTASIPPQTTAYRIILLR